MAIDTAAKRHSVLEYFRPSVPRPDGGDAATAGERAQLTRLYSGFAYTVVVNVAGVAVNLADEIAIGEQATFLAQLKNESGASATPTGTPQIRIWHIDDNGDDIVDVSLTNMTQVGSSRTYSYDFTPDTQTNYSIECVFEYGGDQFLGFTHVTARPKFDPIGLAVDGVLVSRM